MKTWHALWLVTACAVCACSSAESDFKKADAQGTVAAYQRFLADHPTGAQADLARGRVTAVQDEDAWTTAEKLNTPDSMKLYLQAHANGIHQEAARDRVTGFERSDAWKSAQTAGTKDALGDFVKKYPGSAEAGLAQTQLDKLSTETYRVQLAEYRAKSAADRDLGRLQGRYGSVLNELVVLPPSATNKMHRVASAPMTQEDAKNACAKLRKSHQRCEVIKS